MKGYSKLLALVFTLFSGLAFGQTTTPPVPMADGLRTDGKIYVVVAVILVIFLGLLVYVLSLQRRIKTLEKRLKDNES